MLGEELQRGSGNGYITKPYIGVSVTDVSRETQNYGLPKGAAVRSITEDGPAADAGLEENDIITAINGEEISGSKALVDAVRGSSVGDELAFTVYRKGDILEWKVIVGEDVQPARADEKSEEENQGNGQMTLPWGNRFR
ncbi:MAG: PDZ domain-containing protein [Lachnospiraceae bacterium]